MKGWRIRGTTSAFEGDGEARVDALLEALEGQSLALDPVGFGSGLGAVFTVEARDVVAGRSLDAHLFANAINEVFGGRVPRFLDIEVSDPQIEDAVYATTG